ncbi:hypothetical protein [Intrasporangium flavum]|uniref:hypothetical protein n=1 Tax=Intrasporangium flavum TaxID=1428657 RepID=UPI00096FA963|nr:hypothetical protein [Intrasporangium flavum]
MTTRLHSSISSLRALAATRRRGHLAGLLRPAADRDLDRISSDLLYLSQADPAADRSTAPARHTEPTGPVDLDARRARAAGRNVVLGHDEHAGHAQAS